MPNCFSQFLQPVCSADVLCGVPLTQRRSARHAARVTKLQRTVVADRGSAEASNRAAGRVAWSTRDALRQKQLKPKRSLGQNFLQREEVLQSITEAAKIQPGVPVLEIGPGTGNLTRYLLRAGAIVTAVEKDDSLYESLKEAFAAELEDGSLCLIHGDVLALQPAKLLDSLHRRSGAAEVNSDRVAGRDDAGPPTSQLPKVVANLPYNLTKTILRRLLPLGDSFGDLYLMLQDEVARRLVASPSSGPDYRAMNLEVAFFSKPKYLFEVDRTAYFPAPNVDGAIVRFQLRPRRQWPLQEDADFLNMVRLAFTERRKMVRNTLQSKYLSEDVAAALDAAGISPKARPQQLGLQEYLALWQHLPRDQAFGGCQ